MIDIEKVREALKSRFTGYGDNEMLLCYTEEQRKMVKEALTELERLQKKEIPIKPIIINHTNGISAFVDYQCQECKNVIPKYIDITKTCEPNKTIQLDRCLYCNQKLDWRYEK